jgi:transcriptional regulator with XRE-family HTH domain
MNPTQVIGHNIKLLREIKSIKQEILAKDIGISKGRMSQIENGDCGELTINRITKIANFLKTDFFELTCSTSQNFHIKKSQTTVALMALNIIFHQSLSRL